MTAEESPQTSPKPFVFVLMPFDTSFRDIYLFGIKEAANRAGAYAERVDDQFFDDGILERIFNQIAKADVVVADMTGRNANVFYEVGYAHALNKVVILLTQRSDDIPFDLKHRPHIVYGGSIENLQAPLVERIVWGIDEARRRVRGFPSSSRLEVSAHGREIPESALGATVPRFMFGPSYPVEINFQVRNTGVDASEPVSHVYVLAQTDLPAGERRLYLSEGERHRTGYTFQYRLDPIPSIPPGAAESVVCRIANASSDEFEARIALRLHVKPAPLDFHVIAGRKTRVGS